MPDTRMKKGAFRVLATVAVAASLVVAPLVSTGAVAATTVGKIGELVEWTPESNKTSYWEDLYAEHGAVCYNSEGNTSHGSITDGGKTVTLKPYDQSWPGDHWELLVVKGGSVWNNVVEHPEAGIAYASPANSGEKQSDVSHWIVCKGTTPPDTEPTVVTPNLEYTPASCLAAGAIVSRSENVVWTSVVNPDGSTTWTASPAENTVFPEGAQKSWTVPSLDKLPADSDECRPPQPEDVVTSTEKLAFDCTDLEVTITTVTTTTKSVWNGTAWVLGTPTETTTTSTRPMTVEEKLACPVPETVIEYRAWQDGEWECGDTEVTQTREVITTVYGRDDQGNPTAISSLSTEEQTRPLTQDEIGECPLVPGDIAATCQGDVPYLGYSLTLPEGFVTGENPVTVTFLNPDGEDVVIEDQPLSGAVLWPGAKATEPKMWPGWDLVDGTYVPTEGNYAWTRDGVSVRFDVNPTYSTVVEYPAADALCANPPKQAISPEGPSDGEEPGQPTGSESGDPEDSLAATGGGVSPILPIAGGAALLLGLAALLMVAAQRRRATS